MNKEEQTKIVSEVKSILPAVVQYKELKGYYDFDYGCNYQLNVWECSFFDEDDNVIEYFEGNSADDILGQLK